MKMHDSTYWVEREGGCTLRQAGAGISQVFRNRLEVFHEALGSHGFQAERHMGSSIYRETYNDSAFSLLFLLLWFVRCAH